ncbi:MAG: GNAT family N-acetyltransferase [Leptospirales bacterium]|nr:GNAT family N-acetyltransferase [Leptospirales bacterium]
MNIKTKKEKGILILPLDECSRYAAICAHWSYGQWAVRRGISFDINLLAYNERAASKTLPRVFVICTDSFPVGMISVKENDMRSRPDLSPWLSALYVMPEYRKAGLGRRLIEHGEEYVRSLGHTVVYLFIDASDESRLTAYYEKLGWVYVGENLDNDGLNVKIYRFDL